MVDSVDDKRDATIARLHTELREALEVSGSFNISVCSNVSYRQVGRVLFSSTAMILFHISRQSTGSSGRV